MLKELKEQLKAHAVVADAELTDKEMDTLKKMFSVAGGYNALFKYMLGIESEKGIAMAYDMEMIQSQTIEDIADEVKFKKMLTRFMRMKLNKMAQEFKGEIEEEIEKEEKKLEEDKKKNEEKREEKEQEVKGVGKNI